MENPENKNNFKKPSHQEIRALKSLINFAIRKKIKKIKFNGFEFELPQEENSDETKKHLMELDSKVKQLTLQNAFRTKNN